MAYQILVVDDEPALRMMVQEILTQAGYAVCLAGSCREALTQRAQVHPDAILLDVMLPDGDGFSLLGQLRQQGDVPVLFLSARDEDEARLRGLGLGADDYITKPFSVREVLARVRSVLRRTSAARAESESIRFEGLEIDLRRKVCTLDGKELQLTKKEFEILALLLSNRGVIFSREEILRRIWSDEVIVLDRTVDVNITRLRRKIGPYGGHIVTRLGYGYGFEE